MTQSNFTNEERQAKERREASLSPMENWQQEFDKEFTHESHFGERRFSSIRVTNYDRSKPIVMDDQVIADLKAFIAKVREEARAEVIAEIEKAVEDMWIKNAKCYCKTHPEHNCGITSNAALDDVLSRLQGGEPTK